MESDKLINFNTIRSEIKWFIEKVKPELSEQGQHTVYAVKIYEEAEGQYCITIGYIEGSLFIGHVETFKYYFYLKDDLILLDYSDAFAEEYRFQNGNDIQLLTNKGIIWDKIDMKIEVIGTFPGYVCCYEGDNIKKVYYENSDEMPYNKAIFKYIPKGAVIELDSGLLKKIIHEKKKN